jgi:hypothetical protein
VVRGASGDEWGNSLRGQGYNRLYSRSAVDRPNTSTFKPLSYRIISDAEEQRTDEILVKFRATDLAACRTDEEVARKIWLVPLAENKYKSKIQDCVAKLCWMKQFKDRI